MTNLNVREELFCKVKAQIETIPDIRFFDWQKGQFERPKSKNPIPLPACLMEISAIAYADLMQQLQEGRAVVSLYLYVGGCADNFDESAELARGLTDLKIIDTVAEAVQWLAGTQFKPLSQKLEQSLSQTHKMLAYRLDFETRIYKQLERRFVF
ncbi:MAG: hypothetical protein V6Z82_03870 [Flavobacteriales bacterium]